MVTLYCWPPNYFVKWLLCNFSTLAYYFENNVFIVWAFFCKGTIVTIFFKEQCLLDNSSCPWHFIIAGKDNSDFCPASSCWLIEESFFLLQMWNQANCVPLVNFWMRKSYLGQWNLIQLVWQLLQRIAGRWEIPHFPQWVILRSLKQ